MIIIFTIIQGKLHHLKIKNITEKKLFQRFIKSLHPTKSDMYIHMNINFLISRRKHVHSTF